jgi:mannosyltransferase
MAPAGISHSGAQGRGETAVPGDGDRFSRGPGHAVYLVSLLSVSAVLLWVLPLRSSLWLDETITYWVIKDGLPALFRRSLLYNAQSPVYFVIAWVALTLGGAKEWVLRLPSILATAASTALVYRLGVRFGDREMGILGAVCFATYWLVADAASTARGYAVGLTVVIAAVVALDHWLHRPRLKIWAAYVVLSVLTVYIQPLFVVMFLVHAVYVAECLRVGTTPVGWRTVVATAVAAGLLLVPLALALPPVWQRRMAISVDSGAAFRGWWDARFALGPLAVITGSVLFKRSVAAYYKPLPAPLLLLACWSAMPVLLILGAAQWVTTTVLVSRYFLCAAPGIALVTAWAIRGVRRPRMRLLLVTVVAGLSVLGMGVGVERMEDWRAALRAATDAMDGKPVPVLVGAGFVEAARLRWPLDPEEASYLVSPVAFYRVPGAAIPLPYDLDGAGAAYLQQVSAVLADQGEPFVLVVNTHHFFHARSVPFREWFEHALEPRGFSSRPVGGFGTMSVVAFERVSGAAPRTK